MLRLGLVVMVDDNSGLLWWPTGTADLVALARLQVSPKPVVSWLVMALRGEQLRHLLAALGGRVVAIVRGWIRM